MFKRFSLGQQCAYGAVSLVAAEIWIGYFPLLITIILALGLLVSFLKAQLSSSFLRA